MHKRTNKRNIKFLFILLFLLNFYFSFSQERVDGNILNIQKTSETKENSTSNYIGIYQKYLSGLKNSTCPMYPSCSNYGLLVFNDNNFLYATVLLSDRLMRCSHDRKFYNTTHVYGYKSLIDLPYYTKVPRDIIDINNPNPRADQFKCVSKKDSSSLFINFLINKNLYTEALKELYSIEFKNKGLTPEQYKSKLICFQGLKKEEEGVFEYQTYFPEKMRNNPTIALKASKLYFDIENFKSSEEILNKIFAHSNDSDVIYKAYILDALISVRQCDYDKAEKLFQLSSKYSNDSLVSVQNLNILNKIKFSKKKSSSLAKVLSIVPGGGYLYTNHKGSALTSFCVNSLLGYATYTSIRSKNYGIAALTGFLNVSFYIGNIRGASESAKRYNNYIENRYFDDLSNKNKLIIY